MSKSSVGWPWRRRRRGDIGFGEVKAKADGFGAGPRHARQAALSRPLALAPLRRSSLKIVTSGTA
jgi:hypothetical protein